MRVSSSLSSSSPIHDRERVASIVLVTGARASERANARPLLLFDSATDDDTTTVVRGRRGSHCSVKQAAARMTITIARATITDRKTRRLFVMRRRAYGRDGMRVGERLHRHAHTQANDSLLLEHMLRASYQADRLRTLNLAACLVAAAAVFWASPATRSTDRHQRRHTTRLDLRGRRSSSHVDSQSERASARARVAAAAACRDFQQSARSPACIETSLHVHVDTRARSSLLHVVYRRPSSPSFVLINAPPTALTKNTAATAATARQNRTMATL